jgi:hypothetical protein
MPDDFSDHVAIARLWREEGKGPLVVHHLLHALEALAAERAAAKPNKAAADAQYIRHRMAQMRAQGETPLRMTLNGRQYCGADGKVCGCGAEDHIGTCTRRADGPQPRSYSHWGMVG